MLRRTGLSVVAIAAILVAAVLLFGSPPPSPTATPLATTRPPTAVETPSATPSRPYSVVSGGELQGAQLVTAVFGWRAASCGPVRRCASWAPRRP